MTRYFITSHPLHSCELKFIITNYHQYKKERWYRPWTHSIHWARRIYTMCLDITASGFGAGTEIHVTVLCTS